MLGEGCSILRGRTILILISFVLLIAYAQVEERYWYCSPGKYVIDPKETVDLVDEVSRVDINLTSFSLTFRLSEHHTRRSYSRNHIYWSIRRRRDFEQ